MSQLLASMTVDKIPTKSGVTVHASQTTGSNTTTPETKVTITFPSPVAPIVVTEREYVTTIQDDSGNPVVVWKDGNMTTYKVDGTFSEAKRPPVLKSGDMTYTFRADGGIGSLTSSQCSFRFT